VIRRADRRRLRQLAAFVRPHAGGFALAFALLVLSFGIELLGPWLIRTAIDGPVLAAAAGDRAALAALLPLALTYLGVVVIGGSGLGYAFALLTARAGKATIRDLRTALYARLLAVDARWHDRQASGRTVTRVTTDIENLDQLVTTGALQALFDLAKLAGLIVAIAVFVPPLAWFAVLAAPAAALISLLFRRSARRAYGEVRTRLASQNGFTAELVHGVRTVRAFAAEERVDARYAALNATTRRAWDETIRCYAAFFAVIDAALRLTQAGMLLIGGQAVVRGTVSPGSLVQAWLYFGKLSGPIRDLGERYNVLQSALASAERILAVLDEPEGPADPPQPVESPRGPARLELRCVRFGYDPARPVLDGVSLEVPPGTTCAVVGPTGAGKTTLLTLLSRIHDPDQGSILLDGVPLPRLGLAALRRRIAVVPQEPMLFRGTVLDNLRAFAPEVGEDRVLDVLRRIGALDLVEERGGLGARLGEGGTTLSRGERQLLAYARALLAEPDLLVLDEATASVDSATEERLGQALATLRQGRTVLLVAHRLATVRSADQIVVLDRGRVVEVGRHEALARAGGRYAAMLGTLEPPAR
jgi:ATP-binding cassette subfamily B protein